MKLTDEKMKELVNNDLFPEFFSLALSQYDNYKYAGLDERSYFVSAMKAFYIFLRGIETKDTNKLNNYYLEDLDRAINKRVKRMLRYPDRVLEIFSNYINFNIGEITSYEDAREGLLNLSNFCMRVDYIPNSYLFDKLLSTDEKLNTIFKKIVDNNLYEIQNGDINLVFDNLLAKTLLEEYCDKEEILYFDSEKCLLEELNEIEFDNDVVKKFIYATRGESVLTPLEEKKLFIRYKKGDKEAREELIKKNLRFVVSIAKQYVGLGYELSDLIQEGVIGLMEALENYDENVGIRFVSYAKAWVKRDIFRTVVVDRPYNSSIDTNLASQIRQEEALLTHKLNRSPRCIEVARALKIPVENIYNYRKNLLTNCDTIMEDEIFAEDSWQLLDNINLIELKEELYHVLDNAKLTPSDQVFLSKFFGVYDKERLEINDISRSYGISRQAVYQFKDKILNKIRNSDLAYSLVDFALDPTASNKKLEEYQETLKVKSKSKRNGKN